MQKEADRARMLSENAYLRGSRNLNNAQKLLFDAGIARTQMASDVALGTLTGGSAMVPMAIRSFGSGAQQARQAGATENQQMLYGTANALKEAFTEKMFDGLAGIHGKGTADDFVDTIARSFAKSDGGQALARGLLNMGGEGLEELAGGFVEPALQSIYNGKTLVENYRELNMAELLHEAGVGMLLGNLGGSVDIAQTGSGQVHSYADAFRKILAEQNETALDTNTNSSDARYKELERKYLEGTLGKEEEDELWRLERMKGQAGISNMYAGRRSGTEEKTLLKDMPYQQSNTTRAAINDQNQFTEYQRVLSGEGPKTFDEFQEIKYNDPDKWEYLERFVEYKRKYPSSNEKYFGVSEELKAWGVKKGVPLPPVQKQAFILPEGAYDPYHIMYRMVERNLTDDDVRSYIKNARCMFVQWGGKRLRFVSDEGICVITKVGEEWVFKTAWSKQDFDAESDKIMEVLKNAGL